MKGHHVQTPTNTDLQASFALGKLCGDVEARLNTITAQTGGAIPGLVLAARLGEYFLTKAGRLQVGSQRYVQSLRGKTPSRSETLESMEVGSGSPGGEPQHVARVLSAAARKKISNAQKERWAKTNGEKKSHHKKSETKKKMYSEGQSNYWAKNFPTKEARANEVKRRLRKGRKSAKLKAAAKA